MVRKTARVEAAGSLCFCPLVPPPLAFSLRAASIAKTPNKQNCVFLVLSCLLLSPPLSISSTPSAPHCCGEWVAGDEKLSAVPVGGGGTTTKARNQEGRQRYSLLTNIGWSQCTIAHSQRHPRTTARTKGKKNEE